MQERAFAGLIGVGRADITPPVGIYARNWGAAVHDTAEGIHRPLTVTALTVQEAPYAPTFVLASLDLGWWRSGEDERWLRGSVLSALEIDPVYLVLAFTHTHAGPSTCREDADRPGGRLIAPYLERLRDAVLAAIRQALASSEPSVLTWGTGVCALAANRDMPAPDGSRFLCGYNPDVPADSTLLVGRVTGLQGGAVRATLVNYACHPTTLAWENRKISPDYVGAMRELVERETGNAPCLFLQGASGELAPREQYTADTNVADRHGRMMGHAALSTLAGMLPPERRLAFAGVQESGAPLAVHRQEALPISPGVSADCLEIELALQPWPTAAEIEAQMALTSDRALQERLARKRRIRLTIGDGSTARIPFWLWRWGDMLLVGSPTEAYSQFQIALRRAFPEFAVVVLNVANGHLGYLPPEPLYGEDIYPVWQTPFAAGSLERAIAACEQRLQQTSELPQLFPPDWRRLGL